MDDRSKESSVAACTFQVSELLEEILIRVGKEDAVIGRLQQYAPSRTLFVLQRVSTHFKNTIEGSAKLRRLMFLEHAQPSSREAVHVLSEHGAEDSANLRALWWLFEELSSMRYMYMRQPRTIGNEITLEDVVINRVKKALAVTNETVDEHCKAMLRPEASWRRMRLFRASPASHLILKQRYRRAHRAYECAELIVMDELLGETWNSYKACYRGWCGGDFDYYDYEDNHDLFH